MTDQWDSKDQLIQELEKWALRMPEGYDRFSLVASTKFGNTAIILGDDVPPMVRNTHANTWVPLIDGQERLI